MTRRRNAETVQRLRADAVGRGFCMTCRIRRPRPGVKTCDVCLDRKRDRKRAVLQARRAQGRCKCGAVLRNRRFKQCPQCRKTARARRPADLIRRLRADAVASGLCMTCRIRQPRPGVRTCDVCLGHGKKVVQSRRARGGCSRCGAVLHDRFKLCRRCRKARRAVDQRRQLRLIAMGQCIQHGGVPAVPGHVRCTSCLDKLAAKALACTRMKNGGVVQPRHCSVCGATDHNRARHDRDQLRLHENSSKIE
jgi:hypothetical protein